MLYSGMGGAGLEGVGQWAAAGCDCQQGVRVTVHWGEGVWVVGR